MKKITLMLMLSITTIFAYAQDDVDRELKQMKQELAGGYKQWVWKSQKMKFAIPATMKVTTNNANEFHAKDSENEFAMYVWQNVEVTAEEMKTAVYTVADQYMDNLTMADDHDIDDFEGAYVVGDYQGHKTVFFGLIDKRGGTNFFTMIIFNEADDFSVEQALKIIDSIDRL
ncbi:MAG: hypothetical protein SFU27_05670 [Thermonemataceae bacterium]|nr:hypothetical protein [Thermonemataceae bacterium]